MSAAVRTPEVAAHPGEACLIWHKAPYFAPPVSQTRGLNLSLRRPGVGLSNTAEVQPGVNRGEIYAICADNTRIDGSFIIGSGTATDTNGNTYRIRF